ncbi:hypothetical protein [Methylobacterium frigidaeris]|uniref:hypothetical protein n=1 Tax=Methylobacterium frigidaeris TaxID=2038277 RepID=UPI001056100B|nr:hypothetical protein [Methylobacterium frigidaeris]
MGQIGQVAGMLGSVMGGKGQGQQGQEGGMLSKIMGLNQPQGLNAGQGVAGAAPSGMGAAPGSPTSSTAPATAPSYTSTTARPTDFVRPVLGSASNSTPNSTPASTPSTTGSTPSTPSAGAQASFGGGGGALPTTWASLNPVQPAPAQFANIAPIGMGGGGMLGGLSAFGGGFFG